MNNQLTTFYIVRHGESAWNVSKQVQGQKDIALTATGEKQANELAEKLKSVNFDEVFSSDLVRAHKTAEILALQRKMAVKTTQALRERSFGKFEGIGADVFLGMYHEWDKLSEQQRWEHKFADEESHQEAVTRFITFLRETAISYAGKNILIVSHDGILRSFLVKLGYGSWDTIGGFDNCGYIRVDSDGVDFFLKEVNGVKEWKEVTEKINEE